MLNELAKHLHRLLGTDQNYFAEQQIDGTYRKKPGLVTPTLIKKMLEQSDSIAIYQKNYDTTIKWICFDFDILKVNLEESKIDNATSELKQSTKKFCSALDDLEIPYLLEGSGNRGFHIWITFSEKISYRIGYDIQQAILEKIDPIFNKQLIAVDLFPSNITPTDGVGLGVKIPLSKHKKSSKYSQLLHSPEEIENYTPKEKLDTQLIQSQIDILSKHTSTSKSEVESSLGVFFDLSHDETFYPTRIKSIKTNNNGFTLEDLSNLWAHHQPLNHLNKRIFEENELNNDERKLLVGMLGNLTCKNKLNLNHFILHEIFKKTKNYSQEKTQRAIKALSSFYFPSQEQIEKVAGVKFGRPIATEELLRACIPKYKSHEDATFDLSNKDIEIVRSAELNYLFLNDEAQSQTIINELTSCDSEELLTYSKELLENPKAARHYKHYRNEGEKTRTLITLKTRERIVTSAILKQLIYFFDMQPSQNSHGYKPNKGFSGGHIFQPWLYLWIKFVSNISSSIEEPDNSECYIVKTDIKSFYDKIPHDNIKRMLLGDVNSRIDAKLKKISGAPKELYKKFINTLFEITETITESNIGLPQGPAYARYLAELYLDNIDKKFDDAIKNGEINLYQRYVDDIFFIAPSEREAKDILNKLTQELALLGLEINNEKTIIAEIKNFSDDFNNYRSQSKYAVDRVSKNFADATDAQQNLAINEFMTLVQSDSCEDDLAFIFSHLNGVTQLDKWKKEKVVPTLKSGIGRGTLYKHLFNFVLDNESNWSSLDDIETLTELQSEVLTSAFINALGTSKSDHKRLNILFESTQDKLSISEMVGEHITYLATVFGTNINIKKLPPSAIINCLSSVPTPENLMIPAGMISHLNTSLNDIKSLSAFTRTMYPLCASSSITKADLNSLASVFYSKLSSDESNNKISTDAPLEIRTAATTIKFYYLLCLFSASSANTSIELLKSMWRYCTHLYNTHDTDSTTHKTPNWFKKINNVDTDNAKAHFIISAIVDGNIDRGFEDNRKIFERFHNLLLIFITFRSNHLYDQSVNEALNTLKDKAIFYSWLIERDNVRLFPNSRAWFERNVIDNNSIILKKENKILFRKPTSGFHQSSAPENEHNGYSEIVAEFNPLNLYSLNDSIGDMSVKQRLKKLLEIISSCNNSHNLPNIYCNERILDKTTLLPFSSELAKSDYLIFEDQNGNVDSLINNQKNFISCFFKTPAIGKNGEHFKLINEKYINNLNSDIDILEFLKQTSTQLDDFEGMESDFYFDSAISAALHLSLSEVDPIRRIEKFVDQYHRFNPNVKDRHIYGVNAELLISDETPSQLLDTVEKSLKLIPAHSIPSLALYIDRDIAHYRAALQKIAAQEDTSRTALDLNKFRMAYHKISQTTETININGVNHKFSDVELLNILNGELQRFESRHTIILNSSEHIYYLQQEGIIYVAAIQSSISKIYRSIEQRSKSIIHEDGLYKSYPDSAFDKNKILSLDHFTAAKEVVSTHRNLSKNDSEALLVNWLKFLPKKFHQPLTTLISAHVTMSPEELSSFISAVRTLITTSWSNSFLIKRPGDYNGTHRILYADSDIGRCIEQLSPINISNGSTRATLVTDNIITGAQIISALTYYVTDTGYKKSANYFEFDTADKLTIKDRLSKIENLDICTVLYTKKSLETIINSCKLLFGEHLKVSIIHGRDIGDDALFATTQKIGEAEKSTIRALLNNHDAMHELFSHLHTTSSLVNFSLLNDDEINRSNLVARFKSLPKKCFNFLCLGLKYDQSCHPLVRVQEANE